jgi:hypothetical protein
MFFFCLKQFFFFFVFASFETSFVSFFFVTRWKRVRRANIVAGFVESKFFQLPCFFLPHFFCILFSVSQPSLLVNLKPSPSISPTSSIAASMGNHRGPTRSRSQLADALPPDVDVGPVSSSLPSSDSILMPGFSGSTSSSPGSRDSPESALHKPRRLSRSSTSSGAVSRRRASETKERDLANSAHLSRRSESCLDAQLPVVMEPLDGDDASILHHLKVLVFVVLKRKKACKKKKKKNRNCRSLLGLVMFVLTQCLGCATLLLV